MIDKLQKTEKYLIYLKEYSELQEKQKEKDNYNDLS